MEAIVFCDRCRGMRVGWNRLYVLHSIRCTGLPRLLYRSSKLLILILVLSLFVFTVPTPTALVYSDLSSIPTGDATIAEAGLGPIFPAIRTQDVAIAQVENFLQTFKVDPAHRTRIAKAVVNSSRKYNIDSRLIASIMIVESRANPFAISAADSIGIMQIHLPTWGNTADKEGINLFKVEDNVDFGVRILKDYVRQYGLWDGVRRYNGWNADDPQSAQNVEEYVQKIQRIYSPATTEAN